MPNPSCQDERSDGSNVMGAAGSLAGLLASNADEASWAAAVNDRHKIIPHKNSALPIWMTLLASQGAISHRPPSSPLCTMLSMQNQRGSSGQVNSCAPRLG